MVNQIVKFDVKPEHAATFKAALVENKKGADQETGCLELKLFVDNANPSLFFAYERFEDEAAVAHHTQQPYTQRAFELMEIALQSPADVLKLGETTPAPLYEANPKKANPEDELFIIFFIFKIKDGYRENLLKQFEKHVECTRREEEGNILFDLYTIDGQDDTLAVYEHWRKESDVWDIHFNQPYAVETGQLMHEAVVGDLEPYMNFVTEFE
jgi:quinol monooxygenase YgiN